MGRLTLMTYDDTVTITRPSGDTQDADGTVNTGSGTEIYSGSGDFQEGNFTRLVDPSGGSENVSNGALYLPTVVDAIKNGDLVSITQKSGNVRDGRVVRVSTIDDRVFVLVS